MARQPKKPKFARFNQSLNCFGERARPISELFDYLPADQDLVLEIGCGRAELSLAYAQQNPMTNYVGIDLKSDRMYRPAEQALKEKLENLAFVQANVVSIDEVFAPNLVSEIWVTFPDPWPRKGDIKKRLINPTFIKKYQGLLKSGGKLHFKTDDKQLFAYSLEVLTELKIEPEVLSRDVQGDNLDFPLTTYEKQWLAAGKTINYWQITL